MGGGDLQNSKTFNYSIFNQIDFPYYNDYLIESFVTQIMLELEWSEDPSMLK